MRRVKKPFELTRLEFEGKSYYVTGTAYADYDDGKICGMEIVIEACMEMPVCAAPAGIKDVIAECLEQDDEEWEYDN